jgi:hypothetical protein
MKRAKHVEWDKMADMYVRRGRVQAQLDPQLVAPPQAGLQMLRDMDLDRPLLQALKELAAQGVAAPMPDATNFAPNW